MDLHTFFAKALFGSFILTITCSLSFFLLSPSLPPHLLFSSPTLWGADQFTASLGGVRLVPALCDWPRLCRPTVVLSPPPPFFPLRSFLSRARVSSSHFFFFCQPLLHKPHMQTGPKSYDLTLIQHSLPLSCFCSFCLFSLFLSCGCDPISTPEIIPQVTNVLPLIAERQKGEREMQERLHNVAEDLTIFSSLLQ